MSLDPREYGMNGEDEGYQLLELGALSRLIGYPRDNHVAIAVLHWLAARTNAQLSAVAPHVEVHVIPVHSPHGDSRYPAFGIKYKADGPDPTAHIEEIMNRLMVEAPVKSFVDHVARSILPYEAILAALDRR